MPLNMASLPLDFTNLCDISFSQLKLNAQLAPFHLFWMVRREITW